MRSINKKIVIAGLVLFFGAIMTAPALAAYGLDSTANAAKLNLYGTNPEVIAGNVIGTALSLVGILFFILTLYGGFTWMTAHGNDDQVKKSLLTITAAIIGLIIVLASYAITTFVFDTVTKESCSAQSTSAACQNASTGDSCESSNTCQATTGNGADGLPLCGCS